MLYKFIAVTKTGEERSGEIDATSSDLAITTLQRRGLVVISVAEIQKAKFFDMDLNFMDHISVRDVVVLSRQVATLFNAQISALKVFSMLATEVENKTLSKKLQQISADIEGGTSISDALAKHPTAFSDFYINMVRAGEEAGKLSDTFLYLADYLDRQYELTSKVKSAMIYPAFVVLVFVGVMILIMTVIIPKIKGILLSSGQELPIYTKIVINISDSLVDYGVLMFFILTILVTGVWYLSRIGTLTLSTAKVSLPIVGGLYRKLYLSRISDNLYTMLSSGVPMLRAIEVTANVVDDRTYEGILRSAITEVKGGAQVSESLSGYDEIPHIMIVMMKVGEETGELSNIMQVMAKYYQREVNNAIDGLVSLIEPAMIVLLGLGVGVVMGAVMMPIYNIAGSI